MRMLFRFAGHGHSPDPPPGVVSDLVAEAPSAGTVVLSFTRVPYDLGGHEFRYGLTSPPTGDWAALPDTDTIVSLPEGQTVYFQVRGIGLRGRRGAASNIASVLTLVDYTDGWADDFNRANGNLEASAAPNTWMRNGGSAGDIAIGGNDLTFNHSTSAGSLYTMPDVGTPDHYSEVDDNVNTNFSMWLVARAIDVNNLLTAVKITYSPTTYRIYKRVDGTLTVVATSGTEANSGRLRLEVIGDSARLLLDDVEIITWTADADLDVGGALETASLCGLMSRSTARSDAADNYAYGTL
jgi:hypothetical protein